MLSGMEESETPLTGAPEGAERGVFVRGAAWSGEERTGSSFFRRLDRSERGYHSFSPLSALFRTGPGYPSCRQRRTWPFPVRSGAPPWRALRETLRMTKPTMQRAVTAWPRLQACTAAAAASRGGIGEGSSERLDRWRSWRASAWASPRHGAERRA